MRDAYWVPSTGKLCPDYTCTEYLSGLRLAFQESRFASGEDNHIIASHIMYAEDDEVLVCIISLLQVWMDVLQRMLLHLLWFSFV